MESELLKIIMKKYKLKEKENINMKILNNISHKENIDIKDLCCIFQIYSCTLWKLRKGVQKNTSLRFNKFVGIKNEKLISKEEIGQQELYEIKNKMNIKETPLIRKLGISKYKYNKLINNEIEKVKIIDIKIKHIVDLIKIDLKYLKKYGSRYYSVKELTRICEKRDISLNQFIKYFGKNDKHYKFNIMVIEKSKKGLWIGENEKISDEFIKQNEQKLKKDIKSVLLNINSILKNSTYMEDLINDAFLEIYEKCGDIVKKFYFDMKVLFNILKAKSRYILMRIYNKKYKNYNIIHYDKFEKNFLDHITLFKDNNNYEYNI